MKKITFRKIYLFIFVAILGLGAFPFSILKPSSAEKITISQVVQKTTLAQTITANGDVESENQATLPFLNAGRVAWVGVKEGDSVQKGQVLASLDNTVASNNLAVTQANVQSAQAALNKVLDDIHLSQYGNGGFANVGSANETQTQKTDRQEAEAAVNTANDNLQNAQKQLDLLDIIAPFDGKVVSVQNVVDGMNVAPGASSAITLVGEGNLKFVANVADEDIDQIHLGQQVVINLDTDKNMSLSGTVTKIAGNKTTLPDGRNVIKVDIESSDLQSAAQVGQTGSVLIKIDQGGLITVPSWTVLANKYIWVYENNKPILKEIKVGQTVGDKTQVISGLSEKDQVILDPKVIANGKYTLL